MKVLFVGGFLGSGKTTIINRLIRCMADQGLRTAIVENEIGEIGIDAAILGDGKARITALNGGCVCCELFGNLLDAIGDVRTQIDPDWLIIETTGLAMLDSIKTNYEKYGSAEIPFYLVAVADCARFELLWDVITPLLTGQLASADIVLLSKTDVAAPTEHLQKIIAETASEAQILDVSKTADSDIWSAIDTILKGRAPHVGTR